MDGLLTVEQVAEAFHVDRETVRNWLRSGRLPGRHVGRRWYVLADDVRDMMKGGAERESGKGSAEPSSSAGGRSLSASGSRSLMPRIIG